MSQVANYCEIDPLLPREKQVKRIPLPPYHKMTISEFYTKYRTLKTKAEKGALMRQMIAWNDIPSDIWKDLEENFPIKNKSA